MVAAGAERIGASAGVGIVEEERLEGGGVGEGLGEVLLGRKISTTFLR